MEPDAKSLPDRLRNIDSRDRWALLEAAVRIEDLEAEIATYRAGLASPSEKCEHDSENGTFAWECTGCGRLRKDEGLDTKSHVRRAR